MQAVDTPQPKTRTYYVAAELHEWDFAPGGTNKISGQPPVGVEGMLLSSAPDRIGHIYRKALYREYTDETFSVRKERGADWEHLGYLGPVLRAVVGDTLEIVFRNNGDRPYSMHPHGVFYDKDSEGALYDDGTVGPDKADDGVPPGETFIYKWPVPERAGPAARDGSSIMWMYHSHVNEPSDVNAGLMGTILVTSREMAREDGTPKDIDREFVVSFTEFDENLSWYFEENINTYAGDPESVVRTIDFADMNYLVNLRETINGFSYGHLPGLTMKVGEKVRWYVFGSTNFEVHAPHWHGQTAVVNDMRTDVLSLMTMQMTTADMVPDNPGKWLFHCHVAPHMMFGMSAFFVVEDS